MGQRESKMGPDTASARGKDSWYCPVDIADDLKDVDLPSEVKAEVLDCSWEYTRCAAPQYTNWGRYVAFMRTMVVCTVAEFRGKLVNVESSDNLLGYGINATLATLFGGTPIHADMAREFRTFLLITSDKSSNRRNGELFRRYVNSLAQSPKQWFRMRDCDALVRYTMACALASNDHDDVWFTEEQLQILSEIFTTLYDAVAFFKHRSEGETNNTYAYMPEHLRVKAYRQSREILWALDAAWAHHPGRQVAVNFIRLAAGPIHMMMRRYRFVEENLTIGKPETKEVINQARRNAKLWNRIDGNKRGVEDTQRYKDLLTRSDELMFPGLAEFLETGGDGGCKDCRYRASYGAETPHEFGGVKLCGGCKTTWQKYLESLPERARKVFPEIILVEARWMDRPESSQCVGSSDQS
ncbi:hypothetical protein V500_01209 [Pseudogymnoascus sp. VKM F-4518 (FW-2643)]|nr:hypothetical protein V500_01209 [Pseudogymnoascus sp. VKM F-4518 (FW-2643)]